MNKETNAAHTINIKLFCFCQIVYTLFYFILKSIFKKTFFKYSLVFYLKTKITRNSNMKCLSCILHNVKKKANAAHKICWYL